MSYFFLVFGASAFLVLGPLAAGLTADASKSLHFLDWGCSQKPRLNLVACTELDGPASGAGLAWLLYMRLQWPLVDEGSHWPWHAGLGKKMSSEYHGR